MSNSNLLVPGTGGITLMTNDGEDIGWPVMMRLRGIIHGIQGKSRAELIELASMEHRPGQIAPVRTSLKPGTSLQPGHVLRVAYNQVQDFNQFLYDWRADLRHSASQLLDFLTQRRPSGGKWNIAGHSQGGLLIILASKMLPGTRDFSKMVANVTLVGTPVAGTLNAAEALILGNNAGKKLAPAMRKIIRTWPGIYQQLPAWSAVVKADGSPAASSRQLMEAQGWPGIDVPADLLLRARQARKLLKNPFSHMEGVDARFFWAKNRKTVTTIRVPTSGALRWKPASASKGDTLVPYRTTLLTIGAPAHAPHTSVFTAPCLPHAYLLNDATVSTHLKARMK